MSLSLSVASLKMIKELLILVDISNFWLIHDNGTGVKQNFLRQ